MDEYAETVKSVAEATKSVADTSGKAIDLAEKFFVRVLGEDAAGILKDVIFFWRANNAIRLQSKLDRILAQRHISNPRAIPLRLAIPFLQAATLEDDETLQERWARLISNAMDPIYSHSIERCFGRVLEELSPVDCRVLEVLPVLTARSPKHIAYAAQIAEHLEISAKDASVSLGNLRRLELAHNLFLSGGIEIPHALTDFGESFLAACSSEPEARQLLQGDLHNND